MTNFLVEATDKFAKTRSLDDIATGAYALLLKSVGFLLVVPDLHAAADPKSA